MIAGQTLTEFNECHSINAPRGGATARFGVSNPSDATLKDTKFIISVVMEK